jgi:SPRY domain
LNYQSFSDHKAGFAYYGVGQLRHSDSTNGIKYGKQFKNSGVLGVQLNMKDGTLSFSLNSEYLGIAFTDKALTNPPIYAAVSLLHKTGFKLATNLIVPSCFPRSESE